MWGSDFPHDEGTYPHTRESLAHTFVGIDPTEVARMIGENAAHVYGFDMDLLRRVADRIGPEAATIGAGIEKIPEPTTSFAFGPRTIGVS